MAARALVAFLRSPVELSDEGIFRPNRAGSSLWR